MSECPGTAWVVTKYPDGTEVHAHPNHGPEDVARAEALGYPNVDEMTMAHDPLHSALAFLLIWGRSKVLDGLAHNKPAHQAVAAAEEELVLAAQKYIQLVKKYV